MDRQEARRQCILRDVDLIRKTCTADKNNPFHNIMFEDNVFSFEYHSDSEKTFYWITVSDDYPDQSMLTYCDNAAGAVQHVSHFTDRLPIKFNSISSRLYKDLKLTVSDSDLVTRLSPPVSTTRRSHHVFCDTDEDSDTDEEYDDEVDEQMVKCDPKLDDGHINPQLSEDINAVKAKYGADSINLRLFCAIDDCDIELLIPMNSIDEVVARAWKLIPDRPLVVLLHMSISHYLATGAPTIEVFQTDKAGVKLKQGAHFQIEKILEMFISANWAKAFNHMRYRRFSPHAASGEHSNKSQTAAKRRVVQTSGLSSDVDHLIQLGFSQDQATAALGVCNNDVNSAAELLLSVNGSNTYESSVDGPMKLMPLMEHGFTADQASTALIACNGNVDQALAVLLDNSSISTQSAPENAKSTTRKTKKDVGTGRPVAQAKTSSKLSIVPLDAGQKKQVPTLDYGFLVQIIMYVNLRLRTLNEFCVICDDTHIFESCSMLKPTVCSRDLCVFAFQTLGVMSNAAEDIATAAEVIDLLIIMARAACYSARRESILEPYPTVVHPEIQDQFVFNPQVVDLLVMMARAACRSPRNNIILEPYPVVVNPNKPKEYVFHPEKKDFTRVQKTMDCILPMYEMVSTTFADMKKKMDQKDSNAYPLLQWIISSNRSHIVKLQTHSQLDFMKTPHQFLLRSSPPEKEAKFQEARKQYGSTFAFHGSGIENWHSIMRRGLINASGTQLQLNGAAYGSGIYLSPHANFSCGYSNFSRHPVTIAANVVNPTAKVKTGRFLENDVFTCIAICEVVMSPTLRRTGQVWVMPEEDHVCTRFFFVYEGPVNTLMVDTQDHEIQQKIKNITVDL